MINTQGLHQRVAVKIMNLQGDEAREVASRHRDEARLLAQLNHDHIVRVVDLIDVGGRLAFVMEYVEGVNTDALVRRAGPLPPKVALHIAAATAGALDAAYSATSPVNGQPLRVIHRDIKPANLLFTINGGVKVLDFGIARAEFDRDSQTRTGQMGTPVFMAPELFTGEKHVVQPALDTYALGLTLVRLLTGQEVERLPANAERFEVAREAMLAPIASLPGTDAWRQGLMAILRRMLAYQPDLRLGGSELQDALLDLLEQAPGEGPVPYARRTLPQVVGALRQGSAQRREALPTELTLTGDGVAQTGPPITATSAPQTLTLVAGGLLGGVLLGSVLLGGLGLALWYALTPSPPGPVAQTQPPPPVTAPPIKTTPAPPAPPPSTSTAPPTQATPTSTTATSSDAKQPKQPPTERQDPPTAKATPSAAKPTAPTVRCNDAAGDLRVITLSSVPFGAVVTVDGIGRGTTPCLLPLTDGIHTLKMTLDGQEASRGLSVGEVYATKATWDRATNTWSQGM